MEVTREMIAYLLALNEELIEMGVSLIRGAGWQPEMDCCQH